MLTIWGRNTSSNVMKVLWLCDEMLIPYHREEAGGAFGRTKDAFYLAMNPRMTTLFLGLVRTPAEKRDMAAIEAAREQAVGLFGMLEQQLAGRDYLAGGFSIADIAIGPVLHRWFALPIERPAQPRLRAWYERLLSHPGYEKHCAGALV